jgi:solute carrier family 50 (sugar transporter)
MNHISNSMFFGLRASATAASVFMYLSPLVMIRAIKKAKNTVPHSYWPVLSAFGNAFLWSFYGLLTGDIVPLFCSNAFGVLLNAYYCSIFWKYEKRRCRTLTSFVVVGMALTIVVWETLSNEDEKGAVSNLGFVGMLVCVAMFASPLSTIMTVLRTKSAKSLPFTIIIANFITTFLWTAYGLLKDNVYIYGPNGAGLLLAAVQIQIYRKYRNNSGRNKRKELDLQQLANPYENHRFLDSSEDDDDYRKILKV